MNVLYLYNSTQTYTATVFEHISGFRKYSKYRSFFAHQDQYNNLNIDFTNFDAIVIHFTIRLPFDQIADGTASALNEFKGLKVLFIQDEYDHTQRAWHWIRSLGIQLVFTVVPPDGIARVYPPQVFPEVRFVSVLTGYVPENLHSASHIPPSQRPLVVGYRGRPLPIRYGELGREKISIGEMVSQYCTRHDIAHDVAWTEEARIYGPRWYEFMSSCRSILGSESGSNVFDWDGTLAAKIQEFKDKNPRADDSIVYSELIQSLEMSGLMNQVSPRVFEAIAARTVLVLFEGSYSDVVMPDVHFIPLKKDGSNLENVFKLLADGAYVDAMAEQAYQDIIVSGRYSYNSFVRLVDEEIEISHKLLGQAPLVAPANGSCLVHSVQPTALTTSPLQTIGSCISNSVQPTEHTTSVRPSELTTSPIQATATSPSSSRLRRIAIRLWARLPESARVVILQKLGRRPRGKG